jgi:hypothetical protein
MARFLLLGLALPLTACDVLVEECVDACVDAVFYPDHGVEVANAGRSDARVTVVYDTWVEEDDDTSEFKTITDTMHLLPGEKQTGWYPREPLHVTIERIIDGQILFQDHFSRADFRGEHDRIELTVYP